MSHSESQMESPAEPLAEPLAEPVVASPVDGVLSSPVSPASEETVAGPMLGVVPPTSAVANTSDAATAPPATAPPTVAYVLSRQDLPRPPQQVGPIPLGTELGHFIVERYIGGGGMGRVYLAHDTALDRKVAIKVLPKHRAHDRDTVARFMNEARSAARLNHEHIAQVYFAHEYQGTPYIAFEYVEGTNIREVVDAYGTFAVPQAVNYIIQITHAIHHVSLHGVVHRDIKPSNILITPNGRAKLIDMGLARLLDTSPSQNDLTASGVTLGTFDYISPEQARDPRSADIRSDIYSLGCTFFFMLTGRPPFPEGTVLQKLLQHQGDEPPSLHEFVPNIPAEIVHIVQKMMAKDPRQRYQTPQSLLQALVHAAELLGLRPSGPGQSVWVQRDTKPTPRWHAHLPWLVPTLLLAIGVIALNVFDRQTPVLIPDVLPPSPVSATPVTLPPTPRSTPAPPLYASVRSVILPGMRTTPSDGVSSSSNASSGHFALTTPHIGGATLVPLQAKVSFTSLSGGGMIARLPPASASATSSSGTQFPASTNPASSTVTVDPSGYIVGAYRTLASALVAAENNATIEICCSGPLRADPFTLTEKNLRIVAGTLPKTDETPVDWLSMTGEDTTPRRYSPTLAFEMGDTSARAMIVLHDASLTFEDVAVEMTITTHPSPWWSLVELAGQTTFQATRSVFTLKNTMSRHTDVAFLRSIATTLPDRSESVHGGGSSATVMSRALGTEPFSSESFVEPPPVTVSFQDCVVRGEATLLSWDVCRPIRLSANNCLVAMEAAPFAFESTPRACRRDVPVVSIDLQFVTLVTKGALWQQVQTSPTASPLLTRLQSSGSLLLFQQMPLFDFYASVDASEAATYFQFIGGRFPNFFQGLESFGRVRMHTLGNPIYQIALEEWSRRAESAPQLDAAILESGFVFANSFHAMTPRDVALRRDVQNPAVRIDPETQRDAGVTATRLPLF